MMIGFREVRAKLMEDARLNKIEKRPLLECRNLVAADDVFSPMQVPSFDNSAMDGYVFNYDDYRSNSPLKISENEIQAGIKNLKPIKPGEAVRIFTGAPVPEGGDTVIPQELVSIENGFLKFNKEIEKGANIRPAGSQTQKGELILKKGTLITSELIGFLATLGIHELPVYVPPKVGIIVTGKELTPLGNPLEKYSIYESNSVFLAAALRDLGIEAEFILQADDDKNILKTTVEDNFRKTDILIFTGGISVGDYDFVKLVLKELGIDEFFYKVKQKPGKPLYFGKLDKTRVFALPGNPAAVVSCFHVYIKPFINAVLGKNFYESSSFAILLNDYKKKAELTYFVKAAVKDQKAEILPNQLSYQMDAFGKANALAILREGQEFFSIGEKVEIIKFS